MPTAIDCYAKDDDTLAVAHTKLYVKARPFFLGSDAIAKDALGVTHTGKEHKIMQCGDSLRRFASRGLALLMTLTTLATLAVSASAQSNASNIWNWGNGAFGQLGNGAFANLPLPVHPFFATGGPLPHALAVSGGEQHSMALLNTGRVAVWGQNSDGQLGQGIFGPSVSFAQIVGGLPPIKAVAAGGYHSMALDSTGVVWEWGQNAFGQLGDGTNVNKSTPLPIPLPRRVVAIAAGDWHSLAVLDDGRVYAWGLNNFGQLGDSTTINRNAPVPVVGLAGITSFPDGIIIAGGRFHSLAIQTRASSGRTVWAWGGNGRGQLGNGTAVGSLVPIQTLLSAGTPLRGAVQVSAGDGHSMALMLDTTVRCWGRNNEGQLGIGVFGPPDQLYPQKVQEFYTPGPAPLTHAIYISAGGYHSLVIKDDNMARSWGYGASGQLGNNAFINSAWPVFVLNQTGSAALPNLFMVAGGEMHSLALDGVDVRGELVLQSCVNMAQEITFEFRPTNGTPVFTRKAVLTAAGTFHLYGIPQEQFEVHVKGSKWLARNWSIDTTNGSVGFGGLLRTGDATDDNVVDINDLTLLIAHYNTVSPNPNYDARADFNCDNKVDISDLMLLISNYNTLGDP